ncbi:hypothetical protein ACK1YF_004816 [Salmonella enterica]|nr:hypothetical protein [Salmonella enterica]EJF5922202.1 hypothetical protein [Salmonella enterica]EJF5944929.1 hypothetical protein [Salmonella enterica]EJW2053502.1 hypothetical protein [Salmonella enterica]EJW2206436.1 hypothetical protein [Salmonella enterica]
MRLTVGDIKFSESGYASTTVKIEPGEYPCIPLSICTMHVSVPLVEGKTLEQYKDELLGEARERISGMYQEIVCDGQDTYDISMPHADLEKRIASIEKQLSGSQGTGALNAIYAVGKKAAEDYISGCEEHPDERVELSVNRITNRSDSPYVIVYLSCVDKLNCEILSLSIEVERNDRKCIPYYESVAINKAKHIIKRISAQL